MRRRFTWLGPTICITSCLTLMANCSATTADNPGTSGGGGGPDVSGNSGSGADPGPTVGPGPTGTGGSPGLDIDDIPSAAACGNGKLTDDEACDDGNAAGDDGCAADCHSVELGWSCPIAGKACIRIARCGDGVVLFPELCDDGNTAAGDGCSPTCKVEVGHKCDGSPSKCDATACGDDKQEGAESCEDGNALPFDGCSMNCQAEPDCSAGSCVSLCGDGLVLGEECDDGNTIDGDGCSASCKKEQGYECEVPQPEGSMDVPVVFRDFRAAHDDFEPGGEGGGVAPVFGMVAQQLNAQKKPVYMRVANSLVTSEQSFAQWYTDVPGTNSTTATTLTLWDTGNGSFVNRWGEDGEQWTQLSGESEHYCGNVGNEIDGEECTSSEQATPQCGDIHGDDFHSCEVRGGVYWARYVEETYDGTPVFFPVDGDRFTPAAERSPAKISPGYGGGWQDEAGAPDHNFHFTSEIRYWFQYTAGQQYTLNFTGDDDVWVFINDRLAVDVGGIHSAVNANLVINAQGAGRVTYATEGNEVNVQPRNVTLGLEDGKVYQIAVFHAERKTTASTFKLTLQGFTTARSECTPICGDSVVSLGESCDDGVNDGGYGECGPNCQLGEYCGDGIVQGPEQCDDGNNRDGDGCGSGCRNLRPL